MQMVEKIAEYEELIAYLKDYIKELKSGIAGDCHVEFRKNDIDLGLMPDGWC